MRGLWRKLCEFVRGWRYQKVGEEWILVATRPLTEKRWKAVSEAAKRNLPAVNAVAGTVERWRPGPRTYAEAFRETVEAWMDDPEARGDVLVSRLRAIAPAAATMAAEDTRSIRAGRVRVSPAMLLQLLGFSSEHRLLTVMQDDDYRRPPEDRTVRFVIAGPTMPEVPEGHASPDVTVTYEQPERGWPRVIRVVSVFGDEWSCPGVAVKASMTTQEEVDEKAAELLQEAGHSTERSQ